MRKPTSLKLTVGLVALIVAIASVVSFAYFWPGARELTVSGQVEAREIRNGSRFGGRVVRVLVKEGDVVAKGQVLVEFDATELESKIAEAKAALTQALAQEKLLAQGADVSEIRQAGSLVQQARERLSLVAKGARPEELAQAQTKVKAAQSQVDEAQETLENAKLMLEEGIISRQKFDSLQKGLEVAKSNLDAAKASLQLLKQGARSEDRKIAQSQLTAAQAQYNRLLKGAKPEEMSIASANVEKARSALKALEAQRKEYRIQAPYPGYVSLLSVTEGELVAPGRPVVTVIDYSQLWADVYVPESKLSLVALGEPVDVQARSFGNVHFQGRVALINPKSEFIPNTGGSTSTEEATFRVKVAIDRKDTSGKLSLYPGMNVDVTFRP